MQELRHISVLRLFQKSILLYVVLCVLSAVFAVGQAQIFSGIVNCTLESEMTELLRLALIMLGVVIVYYAGRILLKNRQADERDRAHQNFREKMAADFFGQPIFKISHTQPGDIRESLDSDLQKISDYYCVALPTIIANTVLAIVMIALFLRISPIMGGIVFFLSLLQMIPPMLSSVFSYKYYDADREAQAKWSENIMTMYFGNVLIKLYQLHDFFFHKFQELNKRWDRIGRKASAMGRISEGIRALVSNLLTVCTYLFLGYLLLREQITMEEATYLLVLSPYLFLNLNDIFTVFPQLAEYTKAKKNLDRWGRQEDRGEKLPCSAVSVHNLTLTHGNKTIISHFSQEFLFSEKYVVTGENGSGKTSVLESLIGIHRPDSGSITYGGREAQQIPIEELDSLLFYLPQEDAMFDMKGMELFRQYGDDLCHEMLAVAKEFGVTKDTLCETPIKDLSGGERKKIFLSVALSMRNKFLILDEPTNYLDADSRQVLIRKLAEREWGLLVVTHDRTLQDLPEYVRLDFGGDIYEK